ncbi:unnamed protein product [Symbiodinium necroappetens]|uniref:UBA domain-containing protein n=2 Tax=Symbiodinium TaxID=2949 RepID=A0A813C7H3_9DINO|nr:hypothetical protein AK812_SmicGene22369 [Symbiodinium microadriaticum]CAE7940076.1 unnamed protein product [Symbiodinium necroappetens]|mmetsp:Transcript_81404/g.195327  ORF Transcript_81404/g.195327 Transcript_81404/m.195327 type:complete len:150 (-) Transcript_81404:48-497(-)
MMVFVRLLPLLGGVTALPATSLLQVTVQLQRGSVGELAPSTVEAMAAAAANSSERPRPALVEVPQTKQACEGCSQVSDDELDMLDAVEEREQDEMAALASQAKLSLLQTGLEHQHGPMKAQEVAHLHASGIEDADEALALLDAAHDLGM